MRRFESSRMARPVRQTGSAVAGDFQLEPVMSAGQWQQGAKRFYQCLHRLRGHYGIHVSRPARVAPVTKHNHRLIRAVQFDPLTKGGHVMPLDLWPNHQSCAVSWSPAQAHFHDMFGGKNPVSTRLEHGRAEITMLSIKQDDFWRRHHFKPHKSTCQLRTRGTRRGGVEEGVETRQSIASGGFAPAMKILLIVDPPTWLLTAG